MDEVDSFALVKKQPNNAGHTKLRETLFKEGIKAILGERGRFCDWPGETSDLQTGNLRFRGRRHAAAFAFKGPGMTGKLTPGKMGKNGDQLQRLLLCPAEVFFVQYWAQIDGSVDDQLDRLVRLRSYTHNAQLYYCLINGQDSTRLIEAYPKAFAG